MGIRALTKEISQYTRTVGMVGPQEVGSKNGLNGMLRQDGGNIPG